MRNVNRTVFFISLISAFWLLAYKIWFLNEPGCFTYASQVGDIAFSVATSIVASGVFYYFNVYLKSKHDMQVIAPVINSILDRYSVTFMILGSTIYHERGRLWDDSIGTKEEFAELTKGIILSLPPQHAIGSPDNVKENWYLYLNYFFRNTATVGNVLLKYTAYLPPEILSDLNELEFNMSGVALDNFITYGICDELGGISNPLWDYLTVMKRLSKSKLQ